MAETKPLHFAVVGDVHDHFDLLIRRLDAWTKRTGRQLDFVLQVGDLQANRHSDDLETMATPQKYRRLGDFHKLFASSQVLPWPLYFIGGNHEPYGWLDQHPGGATLMPNLHYIGRAGTVRLAGLQVVGMSGIYSELRFNLPRPPVGDILKHSRKHYTFHTEDDVSKAVDFGRADILLLHEWPQGVLAGEQPANWLHLKHGAVHGGEIDKFGNAFGRYLLDTLRPAIVFCGHMHMPFEAEITNADGLTTKVVCLSDITDEDGSIRFFSVSNRCFTPM